MPKSKHRRKGRNRSGAVRPAGPAADEAEMAALLAEIETGGDFDRPGDSDPDFEAALAQAAEELEAELAAADLEEFDPEDDAELDDGAREGVIAPLLQAVEEQIRLDDPPAVAVTLARLLAEGHDRDAALRLIGAVLLMELNEVMRDNRDFDPALYAARLAALPDLPGLA